MLPTDKSLIEVKMDYYRNMPNKTPIYKTNNNLNDDYTDLGIFQNNFISHA
jgi:hypothetical protein